MALIERTIYPRFSKVISKNELIKLYTPYDEDISIAYKYAKGLPNIAVFIVMLKTFKVLNYFPSYKSIPNRIIEHIKVSTNICDNIEINVSEKTIQKYKLIIKRYLNIIDDKEFITNLVLKTVMEFDPIMEHPADIFNAVIEILIKNNCELPAFSTLERLINSKRAAINKDIFEYVSSNLKAITKKSLDLMLENNEKGISGFNYIKELPKSPTLKHMKEIEKNYLYLKNINYGKEILKNIHASKIKFFAAQGNALDASEMKDFSENKRYTIIICLIYISTTKTCDNLITMFIKRIGTIHNRGKEKLQNIIEKQRAKTENIIEAFRELLILSPESTDIEIAENYRKILTSKGGYEALINDCEEISAYNNKNYFPLLWNSFKNHRKILFEIIKLLPIISTTQDNLIIEAINYLLKCEHKKSEFIEPCVDISFASEKWQKIIKCKFDGKEVYSRRYFEMCVFSNIASEFKTGDICTDDSEEYSDYRNQLLSLEECKQLIEEYCVEMNFPIDKKQFINHLKSMLKEKSKAVDINYPKNSELVITDKGEAILKRRKSTADTSSIKKFKKQLEIYMPERNIMEILCNIEHWLNFTRHFGPLSGSEPKFDNAKERYILLTFGYGSNMGPTQTSKHIRGNISPHMIHFTNKRHITEEKLDRAITDIINYYDKFQLPKIWGDVNVSAAADGTKIDLYEQNLLSEYHIRYLGYGGIAYHHVSDTYIALFSHFIPCGVWEAIYIIDAFLKNKSDIQPDTVHADTQGQSATVFALTYLLGIKLMPRIRNWKDLNFYKESKNLKYEHIESLFKDSINWDMIEKHYEDLFQIVLSIKAGKFLPSILLRKLNNYSKKNKLYQAFRELGCVIRTVYLLGFISNIELREKITETTNKTEAYNGFSKWFFFGGDGIMCENDPEEQIKIIKYNDLLSNAVILHNVIDITNALKKLKENGNLILREDIKNLSPYMTSHIKRFGEYVIDLNEIPQPISKIDIEEIIEPVT